MHDEPQSLSLAEGRLAALAWGDPKAPTWLALHGWLDNAASFSRLAPRLVAARRIRVLALDFPGHGHSAPRPEGTDYALWDNCQAVLDALDELNLSSAPLLGHSMGAGVACLVAAALPERVERLMLIDGVGSLTTPVEEVAEQLRKGLLGHRRPSSPSPRYPDAATALAARVAGGVTPIDAETAEPLVARNLAPTADGRVRLRTDGRLLRPSLVRLSPEQSRAMLGAIEAPTLLVEGESGILGQRAHAEQARRAIRHLERRVLPGGHHLHLEPAAVAAVAEALLAWWAEQEV